MTENNPECPLPKINASSAEIREILKSAKTVAVVGLSPKEDRPSHEIARFLIDAGYHVIGVNPGHSEILGLKVYPSLKDIPEKVDIADLFIRAENVMPIVEEAIAKGVGTVWMQLGIINNEAAEKAKAAGLKVVMNRCISVELMMAGPNLRS